jgi:hypothetical protein
LDEAHSWSGICGEEKMLRRNRSRDGSVGIVTSYELDHQLVGVRLPVRIKNFLHVKTGYAVHSTLFQIDTRVLSPE